MYGVDLSKIVVPAKFLSLKRVLNILLVTKMVQKVRPLSIMLPKMSIYRRDLDETTYRSFLIKDNELIDKYNEIWDQVSNTTKKRFDSESVYNKKYLRTKMKSYEGKISTNFHGDKMAKEESQGICLSVILIDSVFRTGKNYYSQVFLEECKYVVKEKKMPKYITDDVKISSDKNSDEENSNKKKL